jgi:hypothetical protein
MYKAANTSSRPVNALIDQIVLERLRAEYMEMPEMKLRAEQVQRLCGIDQTMCAQILEDLVSAGFLCRRPDGTYVRVAEGKFPLPRPAKAGLSPASGNRDTPRLAG